MGLPEANLGIVPGAEGTQRLPRLVGLEKAIEMCVAGKPIKARDALAAGLVDRIIDGDLATGAMAFAREMASRTSHPKTRERTDKLPPAAAVPAMIAAGKDLARKTRRKMEAPVRVVDALEAAVTLPFAEGCVRERQIALECMASEQAKALIHAFFAERGVSRVPGVSKDTPAAPVATVGIVGAGTMGGGIAMACVNAGIRVRITDATSAGLDTGMATIRKNYDVSVKRGRFTPEVVEQRIASIQPQLGYDGFGEVDLIIEAVFENLALKKEIVAALDRVAKPSCVIATNTSTLDIDVIAAATSRPGSVVGLHFFSPANVMRLVEIVRGKATSPETLATAMAVAKRLGKVGVVVGNCEGFVGNRMMFPYMYECQFLVEDGATPEQVDRALTDFGMAMGMFAVDDMAGLDVAWRVRQELKQFSKPGDRKPLVADTLCEMGRFGQKTGKGWYRVRRRSQGGPRSGGRRVDREGGVSRRHPQAAVHERGDHRADDLRPDQRRRARARGRVRQPRRGYRRRLHQRVRLPRLARGSDVLRRSRWAGQGLRARLGLPSRTGSAMGAGAAARPPGAGRARRSRRSTRAAHPNWRARPRDDDPAIDAPGPTGTNQPPWLRTSGARRTAPSTWRPRLRSVRTRRASPTRSSTGLHTRPIARSLLSARVT